MNNKELLDELSLLKDTSKIGLELFFLFNCGDIKRLDLDDSLVDNLKEQFIDKVKITFDSNKHFSLKNIKELGDESLSSEYFYFDSENIYKEIEFILKLTNDSESFVNFSIDNEKYKNVQAILLKIGTEESNIILYKHHYPIHVLKKGTSINIFKSGDTFKEVNDDIFKIDINFDLILVNKHIIINKMKTLENKLGYRERIISIANNHLEVITTLNFIQDIKHLEKAIQNSRWAKKLNKVQSSPVLNIIRSEQEKVIHFIQTHPLLKSIKICICRL